MEAESQPQDECKSTSDAVSQMTNDWWEVLREAKICGRLENFEVKEKETNNKKKKKRNKARGNAGQEVFFDWMFIPSEKSAASRSPWFDWVGMSWSIRFQRSPFTPSIPHSPARSLFVDLKPPFQQVYRVNGCISLEYEQKSINLWKFSEEFEPAWDGQEICTWCRRRLNLERFVQAMDGQEIHLRIKLGIVGRGRPLLLAPVQNTIESLPMTLKVGTTTLSTRFGWDIRRHLNNFSAEMILFWKSLMKRKKSARKIKFSPRDMAIAVKQWEISGVCTWKGCNELKSFVVKAIHDAVNGFVAVPYHIVFLDFDLMDGSGNDDDPKEEYW
eukprot:CAMPEP_0117751984 /NCGR_PEP_ID=MMETSP0947-20121206/11321_1 /TAXON_ID=44440 /ORGANISM="Chattonella subsalsa, Strain CCMP2191" /LENGTH=328 /DNA_ID=CAMNT_0005570511 /DNA_START=95 /DNA_END=1078 /DNA_ORIENTATION=+